MPTKTISAREFHQNTAGASRAAKQGPVIVTNRGLPSLVLITYDEYRSLGSLGTNPIQETKSIADLLAMPEGTPEFDFDFEELRSVWQPREIDLD